MDSDKSIQDSVNLTADKNCSLSLQETPNPHLRQTYETVLAILFLLITMIIAMLGNTAVIAVVYRQRSMRRDIPNLLIINLSVTDLSNTLFVMLSALIALISDEWTMGKVWCDFVCAINYCLIIVSMLTLCCISIDRHQAIMHPLSYPLRITRRRMIYIICFTWIQGITFGTAPSFAGWVAFDYWEAICAIQWHSYQPDTIVYVVLAFLFCFLIPGIILIYCYSKILKEVKNQKAQATINTGNIRAQEKNKRKASHRSKIVRSLLIVVLAYFICTTPFSVTKLIKVLANGKDPIPGPINLIAALLGYVASAINPLIYGIFRHDFRAAYKNLLYSIFIGKRNLNIHSNDHPSLSGINTISNANQVTIQHEKDHTDRTINDLQKSITLLQNGKPLPQTLVELTEEERGKDTEHGNAVNKSMINISISSLEVSTFNPPEKRKSTESVVSCQQVLVKAAENKLDSLKSQ